MKSLAIVLAELQCVPVVDTLGSVLAWVPRCCQSMLFVAVVVLMVGVQLYHHLTHGSNLGCPKVLA